MSSLNTALCSATVGFTTLLLTVAACAQTPPAEPVTVTAPVSATDLSARITAALPTLLPGWTLSQPPEHCDRTCLSTVLPTEAELTLTYRFQWGLSLRLRPPDPPQEIEIRVVCMADEVDAFGLYAQFHEATALPAPIATQSYWADNQLHIWRGAFYLRLVPASADKLLRASVTAAGGMLVAQLPSPEKPPLFMRLLPQARQETFSLRYHRQNVLGQANLNDGMVARYLEDGTTFTLALLRVDDEAAAHTLYDTVLQSLATEAPTTPVPDLGKATRAFTSTQFGLCYVMWEGQYVALAVQVHDREMAEGLLRLTGTNIRISRFTG